MPGRDLSADLYGSTAAQSNGGRDLSADLYGAAPKEMGALDRVKAGVAGVNKGFWSDLLGVPVDATANALDLAKAGIGYTTSKITGNAPPDWTEPSDRAQIPGTSDWIARKINDAGLGSAINNPNPQDALSRIAYSGGRVAGQSIIPNPNANVSLGTNAANMVKGALGGAAGGTVGEVAPEWAGVAGMLPQAGMMAGTAAVKRLVRGGDAGRAAMAQRIQDLQNGGIDTPSVGLASGNRTIAGIENLLSQTPGSTGQYAEARDANIAGMKAKADQLRDSISPEYGPVAAGSAIQGDIKGPFIDRLKDNQRQLYGAVDALIQGDSKTPVPNTADTLGRLTSSIEGAPNIGDRFVNGRISDINNAFRLDTGLDRTTGAPRSTNISIPGSEGIESVPGRPDITVSRTFDPRGQSPGEGTPSDLMLRNPGGQPPRQGGASSAPMRTVQITIPGTQATDGLPARPPITINRTIDPRAAVAGEGGWKPPETPTLPYLAVSKLRSQVGNELDSNALVSDVPRSQWKQLYAGLSQDIGDAATNAGPQAAGAWKRANNYTKIGLARADDLESLANRDTPEGAYKAVASSLSGGPSVYQRLRGVISPDARQKVVATVIDDMGSATPGQQGAAGDSWSPKTFLTSYNKMDGNTRAELFKRIPGGTAMADNLSDIAKTADMLGDSSKIWSNPSGTAHALVARGAIGTVAAGAVGGIFYAPLIAPAAVAAGGMVLNNQVSQRLLLNPKFVNWLANAPKIKPEETQAYGQRLLANAKLTNDKQFQQDAAAYLGAVDSAKDSPQQ